MTNTDTYSLFDDFDKESKPSGTLKQERLPVCDGGYFDALAAIGFAAMVEAYIEVDESPLIEWTPNGFTISYIEKTYRQVPRLNWLRHSVAGAWRKGDKQTWKAPEGYTKKASGWDNTTLISTENAEVDVSQDIQIAIPGFEGKTILITEPLRQLYGVANKLGSPEWFNLCVYACRQKGIEIINGSFIESSITLNSMVLPQASKGAFNPHSFYIANKSLPDRISTSLSRLTCLAVAGFITAAKGQSPQKSVQGFAIPVPKHLRLEALKNIADRNRRRLGNGGFFFSYDNYLVLLKLLLIYQEEKGLSSEEASLYSVAGASYVPLGNSSSPSGSWQLAVPKHRYTISSVERLQQMLNRWRRSKQAGKEKTVSIDRASVAKLVRGFEESDPTEAASGYMEYIYDVGLVPKKTVKLYPLTQPFFEEIMEHKYQHLLQELLGDEIKPFIDLIRRETYNAAFPRRGQPKTQPNYQMIRSLREVQNVEDFIRAVTEIAIERGVTKIATAQSENSKAKGWANPYEPSLTRLIQLAESDYSPKLLANLILSFALCKRPYEQADDEDASEDAIAINEETND